MQSPHPPHPPFPPRPGPPRGESDRDLVARLNGPAAGRHHAVALLLARHWRATCDYAIVCLAAAGPNAHLVAAAAFHRVLGRPAGEAADGGPLRPRLLVAVRDTVRAWAADEGACVVVPELRKPTGGRGLRATAPGTSERRQLAEHAFRALSGAAQCLLWHTEVEAEHINIPAGLSGLDSGTAAAALQQAREQFRTGCVRAHRELAPSAECRFHNRLLDVSIHRGGPAHPDLERHLTECRYCRQAAEQLRHFEGPLGLLLAETVLGWGARRYLESRPGRGAPQDPPPPRAERRETSGRHRAAPEGGRRTALAVGVGLTALALLTTVLVARSWFDDNGVPSPGVTWAAPAGHSPASSAPDAPDAPGALDAAGGRSPAAGPSAASAGEPVEVAHGRLRTVDSGRCLDVRGGWSEPGAGVRMARCSSARSQRWSYRDHGLLRSAADPGLCLATGPGMRDVVVSACVLRPGEVSYDLTLRGELLPRPTGGLALVPVSGAGVVRVVPAARDGSGRQRWILEAEPVAGVRPAAPGPAETGETGETGERVETPAPSPEAAERPPGRSEDRGGDGRPGKGTPTGEPVRGVRVERPVKGVRPPARGIRTERSERPERPERSERSERSEWSERGRRRFGPACERNIVCAGGHARVRRVGAGPGRNSAGGVVPTPPGAFASVPTESGSLPPLG
ncbi:RICIN domain-containing protein [Streptomyces collinus]|uniref:RICIN domain-containing protein n=1 Tax=Streptomyces collinus TaxID=42684 RepID=UPI0029436AAB|nr:RICIN domain-containing protein [Streptomyces collinus]